MRLLLIEQGKDLDAAFVEICLIKLEWSQPCLKGVQRILELPHIVVLIFGERSNILLFVDNFDKFVTQVVNLRLHVLSLDFGILFKGETHSNLAS